VEKQLINNIINDCLYYDLQFKNYSDDIEVIQKYVGDHYESYDVASILYTIMKRIYEISITDEYEYINHISMSIEEYKCIRYALLPRPNTKY